MGNKRNRLRKNRVTLNKVELRRKILKRWRGSQPDLVNETIDGTQSNLTHENMDESEQKLYTAVEVPEKKFSLEGKRIIDIAFFWDQLQNMKHLSNFQCSLQNCQIINETRDGFYSKFLVECRMCNEKFSLRSDRAVLDQVKRIEEKENSDKNKYQLGEYIKTEVDVSTQIENEDTLDIKCLTIKSEEIVIKEENKESDSEQSYNT